MGPRRHALRLATDAHHRKLDGLIGRLTTREAYTRYLLIMTAFRASIEAELAARLHDDPGLMPVLLAEDLKLDCEDLGVVAPSRLRPISLGKGRDVCLGAIYVLEGSALGARFLMEDAKQLGLSGTFGARHLSRQTALNGRWQSFLQVLEGAETLDLDAAILGARNAFEAALSFAEAEHGAEQR